MSKEKDKRNGSDGFFRPSVFYTAAVFLAAFFCPGSSSGGEKLAIVQADDAQRIAGRVLGRNGETVAGARVYVIPWMHSGPARNQPIAKTVSGPNGHFEITFSQSDYRAPTQRSVLKTAITAVHDDYGPGWIHYGAIADKNSADLHLVAADQSPIGRVVDIEGLPIKDVQITVQSASRFGQMVPEGYIGLMESGLWFDGEPALARFRFETDEKGMFRLTGIGPDRHLTLFVSGRDITSQVVQFKPDKHLTSGEKTNGETNRKILTIVGERGQAVEGIVKDAQTGAPLAGVVIQPASLGDKYLYQSAEFWAVRSDERGRFRLAGLPIGYPNGLIAMAAGDQPYFVRRVSLPRQRSDAPIRFDITMHRGIWITGRVVDKSTDQPIRAEIHYAPVRPNEHADEVPFFDSYYEGFRPYVTSADGTYRLVGLPGPGLVSVETLVDYSVDESVSKIEQTEAFKKNELTYDGRRRPNKYWANAVKRIDPKSGSNSVTCDFGLQPK